MIRLEFLPNLIFNLFLHLFLFDHQCIPCIIRSLTRPALPCLALSRLANVALRTTTSKPSREELNEFNKQINYFKGLIHVDKLKSPSEKLMATQILSPNVSLMNDTNVHSNSDFYLHSQAIYTKEIRDELFKKENKFVEKPKEEDLSTILKEHEKKQEKFSENMVLLARNLKQNLMTANTIIKNDTMVSDDQRRFSLANEWLSNRFSLSPPHTHRLSRRRPIWPTKTRTA